MAKKTHDDVRLKYLKSAVDAYEQGAKLIEVGLKRASNSKVKRCSNRRRSLDKLRDRVVSNLNAIHMESPQLLARIIEGQTLVWFPAHGDWAGIPEPFSLGRLQETFETFLTLFASETGKKKAKWYASARISFDALAKQRRSFFSSLRQEIADSKRGTTTLWTPEMLAAAKEQVNVIRIECQAKEKVVYAKVAEWLMSTPPWPKHIELYGKASRTTKKREVTGGSVKKALARDYRDNPSAQ